LPEKITPVRLRKRRRTKTIFGTGLSKHPVEFSRNKHTRPTFGPWWLRSHYPRRYAPSNQYVPDLRHVNGTRGDTRPDWVRALRTRLIIGPAGHCHRWRTRPVPEDRESASRSARGFRRPAGALVGDHLAPSREKGTWPVGSGSNQIAMTRVTSPSTMEPTAVRVHSRPPHPVVDQEPVPVIRDQLTSP
jgi:hypothetical protein